MAVRSTILTHNVDAGGTMTTTVPGDWEVGDYVVVGVYIGGTSTPAGTGPSAFDELIQTSLGNTQGLITQYGKALESGDTAWTWGVAQDTRGLCAAAFYDVEVVTAATSADQDIFTAGNPITLPSFSNEEQDAVVTVFSGARWYSVGDRGPTYLSDIDSGDMELVTLFYDDQAPSDGGRLGIYMAYAELPIGDVPAVTLTWDNFTIPGTGNIGEAVNGCRTLLSTVDTTPANTSLQLDLQKIVIGELPYMIHTQMLDG